MTTSNEPNWLEELQTEAKGELRPEIVNRVNQHCRKTGRHQQEVWRSIYARLSFPLPTKGNKLDYIEKEGKIADLYRIAIAL